MAKKEDSQIVQELIADLTEELEQSDENFNQVILASKVRAAVRDVRRARRYPKYYTEERIEDDLYDYYSNCRAIALSDYNKAGVDFEDSHTENSISASYTDRDKLFAGIVPFAK